MAKGSVRKRSIRRIRRNHSTTVAAAEGMQIMPIIMQKPPEAKEEVFLPAPLGLWGSSPVGTGWKEIDGPFVVRQLWHVV